MNLVFEPTPKQFQAWEFLTDNETREIGLGGGAGGGKSWLGSFWLLSMAIANPGTRWLMGRKELINLKRTTLVTFFKVCAANGLMADKDYTYNQQLNVIRFPNGSEILLFDLSYSPSDPEYTRLGGLELTGAFVDESNEVGEKAISILNTRLGRQYNDKYSLLPKLLETFNPNKGHIYLRYWKPWKANTLPPHRKFVRSLATDNPHLTKDYLGQLRGADKITRERLLEGNFDYDDDPYVLMGYDAITDIFSNTLEQSPQKYMTVDAARLGGDFIVIMLWKGLEAYKTVHFNRTALDVTIEKIRTLAADEMIPWSKILVDEEGVGGGIIDIMRGVKGFIGSSSPLPRIKDGKPENYRNLRAQCYFELAEKINNRQLAIRMSDLDIRERIVMELQQVKRINVDKDQKHQIIAKDEMKKNLGHSPDFSDTLMMRMFWEIRPKSYLDKMNEKPKDWMTREIEDYKKSLRKPLAARL